MEKKNLWVTTLHGKGQLIAFHRCSSQTIWASWATRPSRHASKSLLCSSRKIITCLGSSCTLGVVLPLASLNLVTMLPHSDRAPSLTNSTAIRSAPMQYTNRRRVCVRWAIFHACTMNAFTVIHGQLMGLSTRTTPYTFGDSRPSSQTLRSSSCPGILTNQSMQQLRSITRTAGDKTITLSFAPSAFRLGTANLQPATNSIAIREVP